MLSTTPPWRGVPLQWLRTASAADLLKVGCLVALFVAIFSGRFSFVRFADELARSDWLQLRFWFSALALAGWAALQRHGDRSSRLRLGAELIIWLALFFLLYAYLLANVVVLGDASSVAGQITDIAITATQAWLIIQIVRSETDLAWFARIAEGVGVVLFILCLAGFGNPDVNGASWAPFGGPITFYRLEFLAFCCALYLYAREGEPLPLLHLLVAAIALFSTLASLSKTALFSAVIAAALILFWFVSVRRWRQALLVGVTVAIALSAFASLRGKIMAARVNEAVETPIALLGDEQAGRRDWPVAVLRRIQAGENVRFADLPAWQQRYIRAVVTDDNLDKLPLPAILENVNRLVIYQDSTARARLWSEAWFLYRSSPWIGVGIGNYLIEDINRYSKEIELYRYPHNIVLEMAAFTGTVGVVLFSLLALHSLVCVTRRAMKQPALVCAMAYLVFVLATALSSGDYFDFRVFWLFALLVLAATAGRASVPIGAGSTKMRLGDVPSVSSDG
jgi:O-antigen ligase